MCLLLVRIGATVVKDKRCGQLSVCRVKIKLFCQIRVEKFWEWFSFFRETPESPIPKIPAVIVRLTGFGTLSCNLMRAKQCVACVEIGIAGPQGRTYQSYESYLVVTEAPPEDFSRRGDQFSMTDLSPWHYMQLVSSQTIDCRL